MDHTSTLPFLIENSFGSSDEPVSVYCSKRGLAGVRRPLLQRHLARLHSVKYMYPSVRFRRSDQTAVCICISSLPSGDLEITAIPGPFHRAARPCSFSTGRVERLPHPGRRPHRSESGVADETEDLAADHHPVFPFPTTSRQSPMSSAPARRLSAQARKIPPTISPF